MLEKKELKPFPMNGITSWSDLNQEDIDRLAIKPPDVSTNVLTLAMYQRAAGTTVDELRLLVGTTLRLREKDVWKALDIVARSDESHRFICPVCGIRFTDSDIREGRTELHHGLLMVDTMLERVCTGAIFYNYDEVSTDVATVNVTGSLPWNSILVRMLLWYYASWNRRNFGNSPALAVMRVHAGECHDTLSENENEGKAQHSRKKSRRKYFEKRGQRS